MNIRGLKQASRQCLRDSRCHPWRLTLLFLLCVYAVTLLSDGIAYLLELQVRHASGLDAVALSSRVDLWNVFSALVLNLVIGGLWNAGYWAFALRLSRGKDVHFQDFLTGFRLFGKVLAVLLLQMLYVFLWMLLLILPGYVAFYRYRMALFIILDDPELSATQALRISARLTYGHKMELFLLDLSFWWYFLPLVIEMTLTELYAYGFLPQTAQWQLGLYLYSLLAPAVMQALGQVYVFTTDAHAYNWLCALDRARWEEARGQSEV